jgi:hypothetical protein
MAELTLAESNISDWKRTYEQALNESDAGKLIARICAAESALCVRLQQMSYGPTHRDEAMAIYDAVHSLRLLRSKLYACSKRDELTLLRRRSA